MASYRVLGDELYQSNTQNNLSILLFEHGQLTDSLALNVASEAQARRLHNTSLLARLYNNRGIFLAKQGSLQEAKIMFEESVALHLKNGNPIYAADTLQNCAEVLLDSGNNIEAENTLVRARILIKQSLIIPPVWLINDDTRLTNRLAVACRITEKQPSQ